MGFSGLRSQAESLGDSFKSKGITSLQQIGGGKDTDSVSAEWKQAFEDAGRKDNVASRTPKTDVIGGGEENFFKNGRWFSNYEFQTSGNFYNP